MSSAGTVQAKGSIRVQPVGVVKNGICDADHSEWRNTVSEIIVAREYADGLKGLELFTHVMVVTYLHGATFSPATELVRRPFRDSSLPLLGVFARRAKQRPSPLGITTVGILEVKTESLLVLELDAIDGTPVLDLKPYNPVYDRIDNATVPPWVDASRDSYL